MYEDHLALVTNLSVAPGGLLTRKVMLVFWVPHIYWRRLRDKMEEIPEDSVARNVHKHEKPQFVDNSTWLSTAKPMQSTSSRLQANRNFSLSTATCRRQSTRDQLRL